MNILFYIFIFLSIISEVLAQYLFKLSYKLDNYKLVPIGILFYTFTGYFAFSLLKFQSLGVANVIWHLFHFLLLFYIGYFFLGEKLTKLQILASVFGIISLLLFMLNTHDHIH